MNDICLALLGNYYNTFSNKSSFYSAFPSYLNSYVVFPPHQVGSLIHHIDIIYIYIYIYMYIYEYKHTHTHIHTCMPPTQIWHLRLWLLSALLDSHTHRHAHTNHTPMYRCHHTYITILPFTYMAPETWTLERASQMPRGACGGVPSPALAAGCIS